MKHILMTAIAAALCAAAPAQPRYDMDNMQRERLDRGVVAIRQDAGHVVVSWRTLLSDKKGEPFDIYRNGVKLNAEPLTQGGTFFIDDKPLGTDATYEIRGGGRDGKFTLAADAPEGYLPIRLQRPEGGETPDGSEYTYTPNDASVGDVDGDGQYEIILKWSPSNERDNSHSGFTGNTLFDCYRLDGTAPNRTLTVQFKDLGMDIGMWDTHCIPVQLQIRLHESGAIDMALSGWAPNYEDMPSYYAMKVGIKGRGSDRLYLSGSYTDFSLTTRPDASLTWNNDTYPADGQTYTFTPPAVYTSTGRLPVPPATSRMPVAPPVGIRRLPAPATALSSGTLSMSI